MPSVQHIVLMVINVEGEVEILLQGDMETDGLEETTTVFKDNVI